MNEKIKLTEEELTKIREHQVNVQNKIDQFGRLYLEKLSVDAAIKAVTDRESQLQSDWTTLQITESELLDGILKKYGEGSLDVREGVFIPEKSA